MPPSRTLAAAGVVIIASACTSLLGVDDVQYATDGGPEALDGNVDAPDAQLPDVAEASAPDFDASPFIVQHLPAPPSELATDGVSLYWAMSAQIFRSDGGADAAEVFVDASSPVSSLVATGIYVIWDTPTYLESMPRAGGSVVEVWSSVAFGAVDRTVYFASLGTEIHSCDVSALCINAPYVGTGYAIPRAFIGTSSTLYFFGDVDGGSAVFGCSLQKNCVNATAPFVPGLASPSALAVDDESLYWIDGNTVASTSRALDASAPTVLAAGEHKPRAVVSDGTYAYWTSSDGVRARRLDGGAPTTMVEGGAPTAIVVYGNWLVWLDPASENVVAARRPK